MAADASVAPHRADASAHHEARASPVLSSFHDLYARLEGAQATLAPAELHAELTSRLDALRECGAEPPARSESSGRALDAAGVTAEQRALCAALSARLDVDEADALRHLDAFFASEHPALARVSDASTSALDDVVDALLVFYLEERLMVVRCVSALLRIAEDTEHALYDVASSVLSELATPALATRCLAWFEAGVERALPPALARDPRTAPLLARHYLDKQLALLEVVFLLYYGRLEPSASFFHDVLACASRTQFGQRQANLGYLDADAQGVCGCVRDVLVFLLLECLHLEAALEPVERVAPAEDVALAPWATDVPSLDRVLQRLDQDAARDVSCAPVLLGLALVLRRVAELDEAGTLDAPLARAVAVADGAPLWRRLLHGALDPSMALWDVLWALVTSPLLGSATRVLGASNLSALAYRAVFKGLLLTLTELVQPAYLPDLDGLVELWVALLAPTAGDADGVSALCAQFWRDDVAYTSRASVWDAAARRFPARAAPLTRLARALAGTAPDAPSPDTALAVVEALASVPCVSVLVPAYAAAVPPWAPESGGSGSGSDGGAAYVLPAPWRVPGTDVWLPRGARGMVVSPPDAAVAVMQWDVAPGGVSVWHILHDVLVRGTGTATSTAPAAAGDADEALSPDVTPALLADVALLMADVLSSDGEVGGTLLAHLGERDGLVGAALALVDVSLRARVVDTGGAAAGYRLLAALLAHVPNEVWQRVRSTNVLVGGAGAVPLLDAGLPPSRLLAAEAPHGTMAATLELVALHDALVQQFLATYATDPLDLVAVKAQVLARALQWLIDTVWLEHASWLLEHVSTRFQLALGVVRVLSRVVHDPCVWRGGDAARDAAARGVVDVVDCAVGARAAPLTLAPLLSVLRTSAVDIEGLYVAGHPGAAQHAERVVEAGVQLVRALVQGDAPPPRWIVASLCDAPPRSWGRPLLSLVPAGVPASLGVAAAQLVAEVVRGAGDATLRLAAHLGSTEQVEAAMAGLVSVLQNTAAPPALWVAVWQLLAALVATQPALGALLLTGASLAPSDAPRGDAPTALQLAVDAVRRGAEAWAARPALLSAQLQFLEAAWAHALAHPAVFAALRADAALWDGVVSLLGAATPIPASLSCHEAPAADGAADDVPAYIARVDVQARCLRLLSREVRAAAAAAGNGGGGGDDGRDGGRDGGDANGASWRDAASVQRLAALAGDAAALAASAASVHTTTPAALARGTEEQLAALVPSVPLGALRRAPRAADDDPRRVYGASYVYAYDALVYRLPLDVADDAAELAASVGYAWSVVDAQAVRAAAWTASVRDAVPLLLARAEAQGAAAAARLRGALAAAAAALVPLATDDRVGAVVAALDVLVSVSARELDGASLEALLRHVPAWLAWGGGVGVSDGVSGGVGVARTPCAHLLLALVQAAVRRGEPSAALVAVAPSVLELLARLDTALGSAGSGEDVAADVDVLVAVVAACVAAPELVPRAVWLGALRETPLLATAVALVRGVALPSPERGGALRPGVLLPLVRLWEVLAVDAEACELLARAGVVPALCTNGVSGVLERGGVEALLPTGDVHPLHVFWLCALRTLVRLVEHAPSGVRARLAATDVEAFGQVCSAQLARALLPEAPAPLPLDVAQLDELRLVLRLVRAVRGGGARDARGAGVWSALWTARAPRVLQHLASWAMHPAALAAELGVAEADDAESRALVAYAQRCVDEALATHLAVLWDTSCAAQVLTAPPTAWPAPPAAVRPSMHVGAPGADASLGTLLELAAAWTARVKKEAALAPALEQCLGVCVTQTLVWAHTAPRDAPSGAARAGAELVLQELDAGLARDMDEALSAAADAWASSWWDVLRAAVDGLRTSA